MVSGGVTRQDLKFYGSRKDVLCMDWALRLLVDWALVQSAGLHAVQEVHCLQVASEWFQVVESGFQGGGTVCCYRLYRPEVGV